MTVLIFLILGFTYAEPDTVVALSQGSGSYEVAFSEEDVAVGPYRLVATDSLLYLLDQLNQRVILFDTSGTFREEIKTPFRAWDLAVGESGRLLLLDNRIQPAEVAILDKGKETGRISIKYDVAHPITAIVAHPSDSLLCISGNDFYAAVREQESSSTGLSLSAQLIRLEPDSLAAIDVVGVRNLGLLQGSAGRTTKRLLAYGSGMLWIGSETVIQDKPGSFYMRSIIVLSDTDEEPPFVSLPVSYYDYDTDWRNVAVDPWGNIYMLVTDKAGTAAILRWRVP